MLISERLNIENHSIILYGLLIFISKFSVLLQLQHIFITSRRQTVFFVIQALIWGNLAFYLAYMFIDIFECVPRRNIWDPTVPGRCISVNVLLIALAGINLLSDCLILALPTILVFQLKMTLKNKIAVVAVLGLGFLRACLQDAVTRHRSDSEKSLEVPK